MYAAACNPSRRAKQSTQRPILPVPAMSGPPSPEGSEFDPASSPQPAPAKRGRKPGPLSRAARETQRKLNHSIIEKARRTKINDALASLRQLVPVDYKQAPQEQEEDADEAGTKKKGKREEKEKEFKLEILERTVVFLKDLLDRVEVLEANTAAGGPNVVCSKCTTSATSPRPVAHTATPDIDTSAIVRKRKHSILSSSSSDDTITKRPRAQSIAQEHQRQRLPSISSWLEPQIDPQLQMPGSQSPAIFNAAGTHGLPSPPSSTHFIPQQSLHVSAVPALSLGASTLSSPSFGPIATAGTSGRARTSTASSKASSNSSPDSYRPLRLTESPRRTPEDENAASLLLQISASPVLGPGIGIGGIGGIGMAKGFDMSKMRTACATPNPQARAQAPVGGGGGAVQAQTPGSMLGLVGKPGV
ncbi:hypothetical protein H0H92_011525 [Tricholoma furcatifolium]|nr:hypothetical protein H0H92_011525 [Tricholoma furcatifolium]